MAERERDYTEALTLRLRPSQKALVEKASELAGFKSRSDAARAVLVTWAREVFRAHLRDAMQGQSEPEHLDRITESLQREGVKT